MNSSMDIEFLCRLCGSKTKTHCRLNIFDNHSAIQNICEKIVDCLNIDIKFTDFLPKVLCTECVNSVENFHQFKTKSNETDIMLRSLFCNKNDEHVDNASERDTDHIIIDNPTVNSNHYGTEVDLESVLKSEIIIPVCPSNVLSTNSEWSNGSFSSVDSYVVPVAPVVQDGKNKTRRPNKKSKNPINSKRKKKQVKKKNHKKTAVVQKKKTKKVVTSSQPLKTGSKIFYCELCPKTWHSKARIARHIALHLLEKKHSCTYCEKKFKTTSELKKHVATHEKAYSCVCNYCGQGFYSNTCLDNHLRSKHTKDFQYPCKICGKKFLNNSRLRDHHNFIHNDICAFKCDVCDKAFKTKECLKKHKKSHIPIEERKKYTCSVCGIAVVRRSTLKSHMIVHTGETPYDCKICEKSYNTTNGLKIHMLTHTKEKSYVCNVCGKAFALRHHLRVHDLTHTGERPYTCDICNKSFTQSSSLNLHKKKSCSGQKQNKTKDCDVEASVKL